MTAGTGLLGGGTIGTVTLDADTTFLQQRVSGICAAGSSIRVINANGTVTCEPDDVGGGGGIGGSGTANKIAKFTGATDIGDSVITESAGNIGIGTASPGFKLEVSSGSSAFRAGTANSWFEVLTGGNSRLSLGDGAGNEAGFISGGHNASGENVIEEA